MTVRERILALRVLEDIERDPVYAKHLGLTVKMKIINNKEENQNERGSKAK